MPKNEALEKYIAELRSSGGETREKAEKKIRRIYRALIKDLNAFLGDEYAKYAKDGKLSVAILNEKRQYAKFIEQLVEVIDKNSPDLMRTVHKTVEDTYSVCYKGMAEAVKNTTANSDFEDLTMRPEVLKRAVENPISGLTLPDTLQKNRQELIYSIKQSINIGLMNGELYDSMARRVNKVISGDDGRGGAYAKSMNIVRTETHRVREQGLMDCAKRISDGIDKSGLIYAVTWRTMRDEAVRPQTRRKTASGWKFGRRGKANHQKMEGVTIRAGDKFDLGNGVYTECPGNSGDAANDCNCRCYLEYNLMTVEEFAKAAGKSVDEVKNLLTTGNESGILKTGGRITDPESEDAEKFAEMYYEEIRHFSTDTNKIAKVLGKDEQDIRKIKSYLFEEKSLYDEDLKEWRRFDSDCAIAQSWQRLMIGKDIKKHDKTLIEHELYEMNLREQGISYDEAHKITSEKFNYKEEAEKYYADLKRH